MRHIEFKPQIDSSCFIAPSADVIGQVEIGEKSSVWFGCVLRGDVMPIRIGNETNIQDGSVLHGSIDKAQTTIGNHVTVGHKALLHGCTVSDFVLIGMGAIVMDNAVIPENSIVAAGSLVTENSKFEPGSLIMGSPAKFKRKLTDSELNWIRTNCAHYVKYAESYKTQEVNYYEHG